MVYIYVMKLIDMRSKFRIQYRQTTTKKAERGESSFPKKIGRWGAAELYKSILDKMVTTHK